MKQWKIPVTWEVCATLTIEANTLEKAMEIARDDDCEISCPTDNYYVDGSWRLSEEDADFVRSCYNNDQKDDEITLRIHSIEWDKDEDDDADEYGYCHKGFCLSEMEEK